MEINNNETRIKLWNPLKSFKSLPNRAQKSNGIALIILNQPINKENESKMIRLWQNSAIKFCVDGGTNRLHSWHMQNNANANKSDDYIPDYICGDLDSIDESTKTYYVNKGTKCVSLSNQDMTDFTKTLRFAVRYVKNGIVDHDIVDKHNNISSNGSSIVNIEHIYCFSEFTGRLDHAMANISSLYDEVLSEVNTYLVSSESLTFLLRKGVNIIYVEDDGDDGVYYGKYCGLFPLGKPAIVTTSGLKWNLSNQMLTFGQFISSSNEFDFENFNENACLNYDYDKEKKHVFIKTDEELLWTMSII